MFINDYSAIVLNEFWLLNLMYVQIPIKKAKQFADEQQDEYILLHPGHEQGNTLGLRDPIIARQAINNNGV